MTTDPWLTLWALQLGAPSPAAEVAAIGLAARSDGERQHLPETGLSGRDDWSLDASCQRPRWRSRCASP